MLPPESDPQDEECPEREQLPKPVISFRNAMLAYAALAVLCLVILHGTPLFIALIIVAGIALKTWLAQVKDRLE